MTKAGVFVRQAEFEVGGPVSADLGGGLGIVNMAGRHMYGMHRWSSALRATGTASYVVDVDYVVLPTDFDEPIYVREGNLRFEIVTPEELSEYRSTGNTPRVGAYVHDGTAYRLMLAAAADASSTDALQLVYRKKWVDLTSDDDDVPIPVWLEALLGRLTRAHARGLEGGTLDQELALVAQSPVFTAAAEQDARGSGARVAYVPGTGAADRRWGRDPYDWIRDSSVS